MTAFSQTGTSKPKGDSITISKETAKAIAQDLVRGDSAKAELTIVKQNNTLLISSNVAKDTLLAKKDGIISLKDLEYKNLNAVLDVTNLQKANLKSANDILADKYKKEKQKVTKIEVIGGAVVAGLVYLLLK